MDPLNTASCSNQRHSRTLLIVFMDSMPRALIQGNSLNTCRNTKLDHSNDQMDVMIEYTNTIAASYAWNSCLKPLLLRCGTFGVILCDREWSESYWSKHVTGLHGEDWIYEGGNMIQGKVQSLKCPHVDMTVEDYQRCIKEQCEIQSCA